MSDDTSAFAHFSNFFHEDFSPHQLHPSVFDAVFSPQSEQLTKATVAGFDAVFSPQSEQLTKATVAGFDAVFSPQSEQLTKATAAGFDAVFGPQSEQLTKTLDAMLPPQREQIISAARIITGGWEPPSLKQQTAHWHKQIMSQLTGSSALGLSNLHDASFNRNFLSSAMSMGLPDLWTDALSSVAPKINFWAGSNFSFETAASIATTDERMRALADKAAAAWVEQGLAEIFDEPLLPRDLSSGGLTTLEKAYVEQAQHEAATATDELLQDSWRIIRIRTGKTWVYLTRMEFRQKVIAAFLIMSAFMVLHVTVGLPAWVAWPLPTLQNTVQAAMTSVFFTWLLSRNGAPETD